jgi:hypothetical protein
MSEGGSRLKEIKRFQGCRSLHRVGIAASLESFGVQAISVIFSVNGRLRSMCAFQDAFCIALCPVEIPASVKQIHAIAFMD